MRMDVQEDVESCCCGSSHCSVLRPTVQILVSTVAPIIMVVLSCLSCRLGLFCRSLP